MSLLDKLIRGKTPTMPKGIICGSPGCGKTTFGASAPGHILIDCENGANATSATRTPYLETWPEMADVIDSLLNEKHDYKIVVIDTIDWMVRRLEEQVSGCKDNSEQTLNRSHGGYGNGKQVLKNEIYLNLLPKLDRLVCKNIGVILLAHASRQEITDADGVTVEKTVPALPKEFLETFTEWSDFVCTVRRDRDGGRFLSTVEDDRVLAKNRYGLPPQIPFKWDAFSGEIKKFFSVQSNPKQEVKKNG